MMQKNSVSVLGVNEVCWKEQGEIRSDDYVVCYSRGKRAEIKHTGMVHKSIVRRVVKKIVCNNRITALKLKAEVTNILLVQVYKLTSEYEDGEVEELYDVTKKFV